MRSLFFLLSAGNWLAVLLGGGLANASLGCSLAVLGLIWTDGDEAELDAK